MPYEKVSPTSQEFRSERQETSNIFEDVPECFGALELDKINALDQGITALSFVKDKPTPEEISTARHDILDRAQKRLSQLAEAQDSRAREEQNYRVLCRLFRTLMEDQDFARVFRQYGDNIGLADEYYQENDALYAMYANQNFLPDDLFEQLLRLYQKRFRETRQQFQEKSVVALTQVKAQILTAADRGLIALDHDQIASRLDSLVIKPEDDVLSVLSDHSGAYSIAKHTIKIPVSISLSELSETLCHELLHALGGRTVVRDLASGLSHFQRGGFVFSMPDAKLPFRDDEDPIRWKWLEEGFVEALALRVRGRHPESGDAYEEERRLYKLLRTSGYYEIEERFFRDAYFEDREPGETQIIPGWRALQKAVAEAYRPNFLVELDRKVRSDGLEAAIEFISSGAWRS